MLPTTALLFAIHELMQAIRHVREQTRHVFNPLQNRMDKTEVIMLWIHDIMSPLRVRIYQGIICPAKFME